MAYGFDEGKNKVNFADYFTYVIDSQEKFDDWVNGVSGNDYSYVAIIGGKGSAKDGAYIQTISNNLSGKTKGIQGFCGAIIRVKGDRGILYGLAYDSHPTGTDYFVRDLAVEVVAGTSICCSFSRCINLTNCTGRAINRLIGSSQHYAYAFSICINLTNCTGGAAGSDSNLISYDFDRCNRLSFCTATSTTKKYFNCYVTSTANETYKIPENGSDTPNGGFNV